MEFKIDTKDTFTTIIPPGGIINAKMTGELYHKCEEMRQSGSKNFIIDFQHCTRIDKSATAGLVKMHEESYGNEQSIVYTGINKEALAILKEGETDVLINIAPTMQEAIDIISMEILERDLFNEEG